MMECLSPERRCPGIACGLIRIMDALHHLPSHMLRDYSRHVTK